MNAAEESILVHTVSPLPRPASVPARPGPRRAVAHAPRHRSRARGPRATTVPRAGLAVFLLLGPVACNDPVRTVSESSLRNATARGAADELRGLGYTVRQVRCRTLSADALAVVRVRCVGRSGRDAPVRVDAVAYQANSAHPRQDYLITVAGREVVRRPCLGQACRDRP